MVWSTRRDRRRLEALTRRVKFLEHRVSHYSSDGDPDRAKKELSSLKWAVRQLELLPELIEDYAQHQAWKCGEPDRYPWDPDCHCGLTRELRKVGLLALVDVLTDEKDALVARRVEQRGVVGGVAP